MQNIIDPFGVKGVINQGINGLVGMIHTAVASTSS